MSSVLRLRRLDLSFAPRPWAFAQENRTAIDRHFAGLQRHKPALWNGRILLLSEHMVEADVFRGGYFETDYASFVAWRDWGFPDATVRNCFSLGALRAADGAFLLGVMGAHTLNAGKVYFPAGTPEPGDLDGTTVDLAGSIRREITEETGLLPDAYRAAPGWYCVPGPTHVAQFKILHVEESASALRARILANLAREAQPELADIRIVRGAADLDPMMPPFVVTFLQHMWEHPPEPLP
ncbi:MAG: NUDIX hydrolase [Hyphomicrobiales bacterium]|nr:NUDIX hydrolase [Hyphomicrobiales bacterium]